MVGGPPCWLKEKYSSKNDGWEGMCLVNFAKVDVWLVHG